MSSDSDDAVWIYQNKGKLYCRYIKLYGDGTVSSQVTSGNANIIYV